MLVQLHGYFVLSTAHHGSGSGQSGVAAEEATPELVGPKPGEALARLDAEQKNIFAAHAWSGRDKLDRSEE